LIGDNNKAIEEVCRIFVEKGKQDPNWVGLNIGFPESKVGLNEIINPTALKEHTMQKMNLLQ
jgi:hypothetical protein